MVQSGATAAREGGLTAQPAAAQVEAFCREHDIGLVTVGPEVPLVEGLADSLAAANLQ